MFSSALQSGQLGPVVSQFQLNPEAVAAANSGDLEQFIKALEKKNEEGGAAAAGGSDDEKTKKTAAAASGDEKKEETKDDDEMQLD